MFYKIIFKIRMSIEKLREFIKLYLNIYIFKSKCNNKSNIIIIHASPNQGHETLYQFKNIFVRES